MAFKVRLGGATQTLSSMKARQGGVTRTILTVKAMFGSTLRTVATFAPAITLDISPISGTGVSTSPTGGTVTSNNCTGIPTGGIGPYTYAWTLVSGTAMTLSGANSATTNFRLNVPAGDVFEAVYRCTVTDVFGQTASDTVPVLLSNFSGA